MTWLYVPSASAQASAGSTLASGLLDPTRAASLSWRGKLQQPQAWSRAWKRGGFIRLLSGLTCELSTLALGAAQWIASCRAIPAKVTASPGSGLVPTTIGGCSTGQLRSSTKAGLRCSSARTCRGTSPASSPPPFRHWSDWAAALRSEYSARQRPVRVTDASGSSCWPTATALNRPRSPETMEKCAAFRKRNANQNTVPLYLEEVAITQSENWATPTARMHKGGGQAVTRADGKSRLDMLDWQAEHWPTPMAGSAGTNTYNAAGNSDFSRRAEELAKGVRAFAMVDLLLPDRPTPSGVKSSETRRRLNPLFVEWLMGWPEGLSGFDTAGTASCHSPQPSPGCGCMNCWLTTQRAMLSDLLTINAPAQGSLL